MMEFLIIDKVAFIMAMPIFLVVAYMKLLEYSWKEIIIFGLIMSLLVAITFSLTKSIMEKKFNSTKQSKGS